MRSESGRYAASPEDIKPQHVSDVQYRGWTCERLSAERQRVVAELTTASEQQEKTSSADTLGVLFLGLPVGSMSEEDLEPLIARLKGERDAIDRGAKLNNCVIAPAKIEPRQPATEEEGAVPE
jgi:hypothetical protein